MNDNKYDYSKMMSALDELSKSADNMLQVQESERIQSIRNLDLSAIDVGLEKILHDAHRELDDIESLIKSQESHILL